MNEGMNLASINQREVLVVYVESKNRPIKESLESEVKLHQQDFFTSEWCQEVHEPADKSCLLCFCHFDNNENTPACKHTSARMSVRSGDDHLAVSEGRGCDELLRFRRVSKVELPNHHRHSTQSGPYALYLKPKQLMTLCSMQALSSSHRSQLSVETLSRAGSSSAHSSSMSQTPHS